MSQLINFENIDPTKSAELSMFQSSVGNEGSKVELPENPDDRDKLALLTLDLLLKQHPEKIVFSIPEASKIINSSDEFIRRRIKEKQIIPTYFGDKPMIHITEMARILSEGLPNGN